MQILPSEPLEDSFSPVRPMCCAVLSRSDVTLCDPVDCSPPGSSVHGDSPGTNDGVDCHALLQGIFPTQESNPYLWCRLHCRQVLYPLSHLGKPKRKDKISQIISNSKQGIGTSLVVQWLRIHLPMQGIQVQ